LYSITNWEESKERKKEYSARGRDVSLVIRKIYKRTCGIYSSGTYSKTRKEVVLTWNNLMKCMKGNSRRVVG